VIVSHEIGNPSRKMETYMILPLLGSTILKSESASVDFPMGCMSNDLVASFHNSYLIPFARPEMLY